MSIVPNPIIVAIDTTDIARAKALCASLKGHVGAVKLGLEFFTAHGAVGVREVVPNGVPLFLDLKFHDIPNTVGKAIRALKGLEIAMLTIHTSGGVYMMQAARDAADFLGQGGVRPKVLGVTVLTSLDESDMEQIGVQLDVSMQVEKLAILAKQSGLDGVICSPHEIAVLRSRLGSDFKLVVPGIRPKPDAVSRAHESSASGASPHVRAVSEHGGIKNDDQKRTMTPKEALGAGADYLVIGRPITEAVDPASAASGML